MKFTRAFLCLWCLLGSFALTSALPTTQSRLRKRQAVTKPVTTECGSAPPRPGFSVKVIGGVIADPGDWPWMVALIHMKDGLFCGGTLVKDQFVLTAAHCVRDKTPDDFVITLGLSTLSKPEKGAINYTIQSVIPHENYKRLTLQNDIAILKLNERVQLSPTIHSACLPSKALSPEEKFGYVTGWGHTENKGKTSDHLMEVNFTIWRNSDCSKALNYELIDSQMCAGNQDGTKDACQGDSGGPLVINIGGKWIISGVVSGGIECGKPGKPGLYTKVSSFNNWIKDVLYSNLRIGCPNGFKNFDEFTCINEYYLDQYKRGELNWDQVLQRRQKNEGLLPTRTNNQKCPTEYVEFDEFTCVSTSSYEIYQSRKKSWNSLRSFLSNKATLLSPTAAKIVSGKADPPAVTPNYVPDNIQTERSRLSCDSTEEATQVSPLVKFDELNCISPDHLNGFKTGKDDWYTLLSNRFEKKA